MAYENPNLLDVGLTKEEMLDQLASPYQHERQLAIEAISESAEDDLVAELIVQSLLELKTSDPDEKIRTAVRELLTKIGRDG